jgi:hypothetical protein
MSSFLIHSHDTQKTFKLIYLRSVYYEKKIHSVVELMLTININIYFLFEQIFMNNI